MNEWMNECRVSKVDCGSFVFVSNYMHLFTCGSLLFSSHRGRVVLAETIWPTKLASQASRENTTHPVKYELQRKHENFLV
jgi:hypothetical protein